MNRILTRARLVQRACSPSSVATPCSGVIRAFQLELTDAKDGRWPFHVAWPALRLGTVEQIDGVLYTPFGTFLV